MANNTIPTITLATPEYKPTIFQGSAYTPIQYDPSVLQRSLANIDTSIEKAAEAQATYTAGVAAARQSLNKDEWNTFDDLANGYLIDIQNAYNRGDYQGAKNLTTKYTGDLAKFTVKKAKDQELYLANKDETHKRALAGKISQATEKWANKKNAYYSPEDGNYVPVQEVYDDLDINTLTTQAFNAVKPDKLDSAHGSETVIGKDGKVYSAQEAVAKNIQGTYSVSGGTRHSISQVKFSDIMSNLEYLFKNPATLAQIKQGYEVAIDNYQDLQNDLDSYKDKLLAEGYTEEDLKNDAQYSDLLLQTQQAHDLVCRNGSVVTTDNNNPNYRYYFEQLTKNNMLAKQMAFKDDSYTSQSSIQQLSGSTNPTNPDPKSDIDTNANRVTQTTSTAQSVDATSSRTAVNNATSDVGSMVSDDNESSNAAPSKAPVRTPLNWKTMGIR